MTTRELSAGLLLVLSAGLLVSGVLVALVDVAGGSGWLCSSSGVDDPGASWRLYAVPCLAIGSFIAMAGAAARSSWARSLALVRWGWVAQLGVFLLVVPLWLDAVGPCLD